MVDRDRLEKAEQSTRQMWKKSLNIYWFNIVDHADMISEDSEENMVVEASYKHKVRFMGKAKGLPKVVQLAAKENYRHMYDSVWEKIKPKKTSHKKAPKVKKSANKLSNENEEPQIYDNNKSKTKKNKNQPDFVYFNRPTSPVQADAMPNKSSTPEKSFPENRQTQIYANDKKRSAKYKNLPVSSDSVHKPTPAPYVPTEKTPSKPAMSSHSSEKDVEGQPFTLTENDALPFHKNHPIFEKYFLPPSYPSEIVQEYQRTQSNDDIKRKTKKYKNQPDSVYSNRPTSPVQADVMPKKSGQASTLTENDALPHHKNHPIPEKHYPPQTYFSDIVQGPPPTPTTRNTDQREQKWDASLQSDADDTSRFQASLPSSLPQPTTSRSSTTEQKEQTSDFRTYNLSSYKTSEINWDFAIGSTRRGQSNVRSQINKPPIPPERFSYLHGQAQTPITKKIGHNEQHLRYNAIPRISERPTCPPMRKTNHGYPIPPLQLSINVINNSPDQRETFTQSNFQRSASETHISGKYHTIAPPKQAASPDEPKLKIKASSKVDQTKPPTQNQVPRSSSVKLRSSANVSLDSSEAAIPRNQMPVIKTRRIIIIRRPQTQIITAAQDKRLQELPQRIPRRAQSQIMTAARPERLEELNRWKTDKGLQSCSTNSSQTTGKSKRCLKASI